MPKTSSSPQSSAIHRAVIGLHDHRLFYPHFHLPKVIQNSSPWPPMRLLLSHVYSTHCPVSVPLAFLEHHSIDDRWKHFVSCFNSWDCKPPPSHLNVTPPLRRLTRLTRLLDAGPVSRTLSLARFGQEQRRPASAACDAAMRRCSAVTLRMTLLRSQIQFEAKRPFGAAQKWQSVFAGDDFRTCRRDIEETAVDRRLLSLRHSSLFSP